MGNKNYTPESYILGGDIRNEWTTSPMYPDNTYGVVLGTLRSGEKNFPVATRRKHVPRIAYATDKHKILENNRDGLVRLIFIPTENKKEAEKLAINHPPTQSIGVLK